MSERTAKDVVLVPTIGQDCFQSPEFRDLQMKPKRKVDPKYLETYKRINQKIPDRPGSGFEEAFQEACLIQDAEELTNKVVEEAEGALQTEQKEGPLRKAVRWLTGR